MCTFNEFVGKINNGEVCWMENGAMVVTLSLDYDAEVEEKLLATLGTFEKDVDYKLYVAMGDDCANSVEIKNEEMLKNSAFVQLLEEYSGANEYSEDFEEDEDE